MKDSTKDDNPYKGFVNWKVWRLLLWGILYIFKFIQSQWVFLTINQTSLFGNFIHKWKIIISYCTVTQHKKTGIYQTENVCVCACVWGKGELEGDKIKSFRMLFPLWMHCYFIAWYTIHKRFKFLYCTYEIYLYISIYVSLVRELYTFFVSKI